MKSKTKTIEKEMDNVEEEYVNISILGNVIEKDSPLIPEKNEEVVYHTNSHANDIDCAVFLFSYDDQTSFYAVMEQMQQFCELGRNRERLKQRLISVYIVGQNRSGERNSIVHKREIFSWIQSYNFRISEVYNEIVGDNPSEIRKFLRNKAEFAKKRRKSIAEERERVKKMKKWSVRTAISFVGSCFALRKNSAPKFEKIPLVVNNEK